MRATLYAVKPRFQTLLRPLVDQLAAGGIRPNHLTVAGIGMSAVAGGVVGTSRSGSEWLWLVTVLYFVRMALNAMDGLLAREHGLATRRGGVLNEVGDVGSDALAYLPFALILPEQAGLIVAVVVLGLITEVAALAAAVDGRRRNDGPLGKSDRALVFAALTVALALGIEAMVLPFLWIMAGLAALTILNRAGVGESP